MFICLSGKHGCHEKNDERDGWKPRVRNESGSPRIAISLSTVIVDANGVVRAKIEGKAQDFASDLNRNRCRLRPARKRAFLGRGRVPTFMMFIPS